MSNATVKVVARITARPDQVRELQALLHCLLEPTRKEPGCIHYQLLWNRADPTDFTFVEEWADDAALDAHLLTPHVQNALAQAQSLLATAPDIRRYSDSI
ncbi:MAG: antibiotic biosynthesis monooxygenase [Candidatus Competibacteraceae bacterium]|uniref:Antibiotic biosynthesis monooxygenase n=1 Tax=Candidatus Contendobacter odensis Run_B_J11 TaxID=1400861 RepID=A0A7U7GF59_9GAMM|nr:putative quinol monooxygenase [Candidatus Contendobacter odensis]MBK8537196.1 antibiotic biosynthesis monooxygenase [Candidatus Competibacteraceae bacterium]CDH47231.1 Antibiotic biosynthesis monooxygenase [Candidatus Contendobacter odensis Run_B_J11]